MHANTFRSAVLAPFFAATLMLVASADAASAQAAATVVIKNFDFSPMAVTVKAGDSVTWTNRDGEPHTVTSVDGLFRSGGLDQNDSFTFRFAKAGVYKYQCTIHPRMQATVTVK